MVLEVVKVVGSSFCYIYIYCIVKVVISHWWWGKWKNVEHQSMDSKRSTGKVHWFYYWHVGSPHDSAVSRHLKPDRLWAGSQVRDAWEPWWHLNVPNGREFPLHPQPLSSTWLRTETYVLPTASVIVTRCVVCGAFFWKFNARSWASWVSAPASDVLPDNV